MTVRLLTNIGRLWTGSEIWSNAAILTQDDRIAWVGPAAELPASIPGVIEDIVDVDHVENLGGGLVTPGLIDAHTHLFAARHAKTWFETADIVAERIRKTIQVVPAEKLFILPDCGLFHLPRDVAFAKLRAMVEGARIVRKELGH